MPWKMIGFLIVLVLVAFFASFNMNHRADISLGFYIYKDVPIFLSLLIAFLAGAVLIIPFTIGASLRKKSKLKEKAQKKEKKVKKLIKDKKSTQQIAEPGLENDEQFPPTVG
jgi:uncharacterized integral membrane protein